MSMVTHAQEKYLISDNLPARSQERFTEALNNYYQGDLEKASEIVIKLIEKHENFLEGYLLLGDILMERRAYDDAVQTYQEVISIDPDYSKRFLMILGNAQYSAQEYSDAAATYQSALDWEELAPKQAEVAHKRLESSLFRHEQLNNPLPFNPVNLGPLVNSIHDEYVNALNPEETRLFLTRKELDDTPGSYRRYREEFYYNDLNDTTWGPGILLDQNSPLELDGDAGAMTVSVDGKTMYFVSCFRGDGQGSCDLYRSIKKDNTWQRPVNLGYKVNSEVWDSQPSLSPDGRTLYFASTRGNRVGKSDLWMMERDSAGNWGEPVNMGKPVNTAGSEMAPFIHFDNQTLYFASDGHTGMGGLDIFMTRKDTAGHFTQKVVNIGYPVNNSDNDITIIVNARGDKGYISAERGEGIGGYDIYAFVLPEKIRPMPSTYMKGIISDAVTGERLKARFELIDLQTERVVMDASSAADGSFLICIPSGKNYGLNVSKKGYIFYSEHFRLEGFNSAVDPFIKDIFMEPVDKGSTTILKNVFFDFDRYDLKPESYPELKRLISFLAENPSVSVEIGGHTDNTGSDGYNQALSENRAKTVVNYLVSNGIDDDRLSYKGYGASEPIASNNTEEGRAMNRRTTVEVLSSE
jgi:outer membrane protein OmpA-like peptidoglycan-associated protein/tetratricopeptide (TPR) repeat protein